MIDSTSQASTPAESGHSKMTVVQVTVFIISAAVLGLELVLVRILSIGHWHHFSYLVISTALLGFAAGGTFVTIGLKSLAKHFKGSLWCFALGMALTIPVVIWISQKVPFDELQLVWDRRQIFYLFAYYLLFFVPFFCGGVCVALAFGVAGEKAHSVYFCNMTGSGLGAGLIIVLMYGNSPQRLLLIISAVTFIAAMVPASAISRWCAAATVILGTSWVLFFGFGLSGEGALEIEINENKSLAYYRALPNVETVAATYSPLGRLDCLEGPAIRYFPGLGIGYRGQLGRQVLIITDADGITAINRFDSKEDMRYYDYTTSALAYHLVDAPRVCVIGAGGGTDVAGGLALNAKSVTAVEMNRQVVEIVRGRFNKFAGGLYRRNDVEVVVAEGRSFLQTTQRRYDIINISLLESFMGSAAGVYALSESHLYTVEAVRQALRKVSNNGFLSITRMLKTPARDSIKMFATAVEALGREGISKAGEHIIMIRNWATATIVVSKQALSDTQIARARRFAEERNFDLVHVPGIVPEQVNRYYVLEEPVYYNSVQQILSRQREDFYNNYGYNIRPATDDRPYFSDFFKWKSLPYMIRTIPGQWLIFTEWGYLVLAATLVQAIIASAVFILLPLWAAKPVKSVVGGKWWTACFFVFVGLGYMFLEMGFIQKMTLLIGHPVFGVMVTLTGFLVFSGLGSMFAGHFLERFEKKIAVEKHKRPSGRTVIISAVCAVILIGTAEILFIRTRFDWLMGFSFTGRMLLGVALTGVLSFFMGMPMPTALRELVPDRQGLVPWAWGVNGFASVTAAVLGTFLAVSVGFTILMAISLGCYLAAGIISKQICS